MDTNAFYSHSLTERMELVGRHGEYLCRIKYYGYVINLYAYDGELIEVYYNRYSNALSEIELLDHKNERLHTYAVQVNLSDLYKNK